MNIPVAKALQAPFLRSVATALADLGCAGYAQAFEVAGDSEASVRSTSAFTNFCEMNLSFAEGWVEERSPAFPPSNAGLRSFLEGRK